MGNKILFAHDGPLQKDSTGNYYGVTLGNSLKERFLYIGDSVTFMLRTKHIDDKEAQRFSKIAPEHFNVIEIEDFKSIKRYWKYSKIAKKRIEAAVAEHDIVVARLPSAIGSMAVKAAKKQHKPVLVEYVACTFDAYWNYNWKGKLIANYKKHSQKKLVSDTPYIIYVTKKFLQQRYPSSGVQTNCSNVEINHMNESDLSLRIEKIHNNFGKNPLKIGTVAALNVAYKGQDDVLKAISVLKRQGVNIHYHLVGHGSSDRLKTLASKLNIEDSITIVGPLKHEEVFDFYRSLDLYIQPSKQEGLPRSVIEAMSTACPVLGSSIAGIPELLQPEMLFVAGNVHQIADKLSVITPELLEKHAGINFENAKDYKKDVLMNRRFHFYSQFLKNYGLTIPETLKAKLND